MILIDALYINNSGGKILLDYLIESIEKSDLEVRYLLDSRIYKKHHIILNNRVDYLVASLINRHKFYKKVAMSLDVVFCFGNLPPSFKLNAKVYTYFHQKLFAIRPSSLPLLFKIKLWIKSKVVYFFRKNTDFWIVQTDSMKHAFLKSFNVNSKHILIIPFYPPLKNLDNIFIKRVDRSFLYVSSGAPHKNHQNLLSGFKMFYDKNKKGELHLTLLETESILMRTIKNMQKLGYPIINHGFVSRENLLLLYRSAEYIVYPSLTESFGLGIIEGLENGCKVLGSDLEYMKSVCIPNFVFNPNLDSEIAMGFENAIKIKKLKATQLVFNEIELILKLLNNVNKK